METKRLNEQVRRNAVRCPEDFAFVLTAQEVANLKSQFATSSLHGGRRKIPRVFTEHGALMAANVLNSKRAVEMSVFVVRAFTKMRTALSDTRELARKLATLEREVKPRIISQQEDHVFPTVRISGTVDRLDPRGDIKEKRPEIFFDDIQRQEPMPEPQLF